MIFANQLLTVAAVAVPVMAALWAVQWARRDAGIVDVAWSACLGYFALYCGATGGGDPGRRAVLAGVAAAWAFRLALHLLTDRIVGKPEDSRYRTMRASMGAWAQLGFLLFFQVQALFVVLFGVPLAAASQNAAPFPAWSDFAALAVWSVAVLGEAVADNQLARFRADPAHAGKTCDVGLWAWSRHPNYFCEWLHWWTYVLLSLGGDLWLLAATLLFGPVLMYLFLQYVTGVPHTERQALAKRPDYADYRRRTSAFFPWFPGPKPAKDDA